MEERTVAWSAATDNHGIETLEFSAERTGRRVVTGALWIPDEPSTDRPLVVFGHGASGDRYQTPISGLAHRFANELGCPSLAIDGPVHGLRKVGDGGRAALNVERQRPSSTAEFIEEWHFAIDLAFSHEAIGPRKVAYFGLSMGSAYGIPMIAERSDVVVATLGLLGTEGPFNNMKAALLDSASKITYPILFLMQLEDELFSREGCLELFDAIASEDKRLHANTGLHPEVPVEEIVFAFEFMKRKIDKSGPHGLMGQVAN